ncbi:hypothetical protein ACSBR2_035670 [Camellia fascicularis]
MVELRIDELEESTSSQLDRLERIVEEIAEDLRQQKALDPALISEAKLNRFLKWKRNRQSSDVNKNFMKNKKWKSEISTRDKFNQRNDSTPVCSESRKKHSEACYRCGDMSQKVRDCPRIEQNVNGPAYSGRFCTNGKICYNKWNCKPRRWIILVSLLGK